MNIPAGRKNDAGSNSPEVQKKVEKTAVNSQPKEDESRLSNLRSGPYQSLLNKVAKRLK